LKIRQESPNRQCHGMAECKSEMVSDADEVGLVRLVTRSKEPPRVGPILGLPIDILGEEDSGARGIIRAFKPEKGYGTPIDAVGGSIGLGRYLSRLPTEREACRLRHKLDDSTIPRPIRLNS
jgi:hypothetical protein